MKINLKYVQGEVYKGGFWFRVFGYGVRVQNRELHPALFSERTGRVKAARLGKWSVKVLKPHRDYRTDAILQQSHDLGAF